MPTEAFPPSPWALDGWMHVSAFRVPASALPAEAAAHRPADAELLRLGDDALALVAMVHYAPGSVLTYQELLVALPVGRASAREASIAQIWVDSPASLAGGRALWGIPKHLARWDHGAVADEDGAPIATLRATVGRAWPGPRLPVSMVTRQRLDGRGDVRAPIAAGARPRALRAAWTFAPDGPLGWLAGREPIGSVALGDLRIRFGD